MPRIPVVRLSFQADSQQQSGLCNSVVPENTQFSSFFDFDPLILPDPHQHRAERDNVLVDK